MTRNKLIRKDFPKVRIITKKGNIYYEVDCRSVLWQGQKKFVFSKKYDSLKWARQIAAKVRQYGTSASTDVVHPVINDRFNRLTEQVKEHGGTSVEDAVRVFIENDQKKVVANNSPLISELAAKWFNFKSTDTKKKLRPQSIGKIRIHSNQFAKHFAGLRIATVTLKDIESVVDSLKQNDGNDLSQQSKANYVCYLKQFFNWCKRNDHIEKNLADKITVSVSAKEPTFFTVVQCQQLLNLVQSEAHSPLIGYISICLFAGLRPSEAEKLTWKDIEFDHDAIVVAGSISKTKRGRRVDISSTLKQWLNTLDKTQPLIPANFDRRMDLFRNDVSKNITQWTSDVLRHTYASFWLSKHADRPKLAELMGNSETIIGKHYLRHPPKTDTAKFWSLVPVNPKVDEFFDVS